jgi:hypothetical protein
MTVDRLIYGIYVICLNSSHLMRKKATIASRPRGRPKAEEPRTTGLLLKLNESEAALIEQKAKRAGKPKAVWIRELAVAA